MTRGEYETWICIGCGAEVSTPGHTCTGGAA